MPRQYIVSTYANGTTHVLDVDDSSRQQRRFVLTAGEGTHPSSGFLGDITPMGAADLPDEVMLEVDRQQQRWAQASATSEDPGSQRSVLRLDSSPPNSALTPTSRQGLPSMKAIINTLSFGLIK
jgi:hypothetical protein